jgi:hypothetical protein
LCQGSFLSRPFAIASMPVRQRPRRNAEESGGDEEEEKPASRIFIFFSSALRAFPTIKEMKMVKWNGLMKLGPLVLSCSSFSVSTVSAVPSVTYLALYFTKFTCTGTSLFGAQSNQSGLGTLPSLSFHASMLRCSSSFAPNPNFKKEI